jgi:hypothetical protein
MDYKEPLRDDDKPDDPDELARFWEERHAAAPEEWRLKRIQRKRAVRRATKCYDMQLSEKRAELYAAGFRHDEVVKILADADKPPDGTGNTSG